MLSTKRAQPNPDTFRARKSTSTTRPKRLGGTGTGAGTGTSTTTHLTSRRRRQKPVSPPDGNSSPSTVVTLLVGPSRRLFAAHEDILCVSPFFAECLRNQSTQSATATTSGPSTGTGTGAGKRITLPDEQPETLSCVLEYLYRGDYYPYLRRNKERNTWELDNGSGRGREEGAESSGEKEAAIFDEKIGGWVLRDTAVYCAATKYSLPNLKSLSLQKQGLQSSIQASTILTSARYAYAHTPDTESKLRAHYLALIIRCRTTFVRSGTMQLEMERGGRMFFDLFVALCNFLDDVQVQDERRLVA